VTPEYVQACQAALSEPRGKVILKVVCRTHGLCGDVRSSSRGMIFVTNRPLRPEKGWIRDRVAMRARRRDTGRVKPVIAVLAYLFEHPDRPAAVPLQCQGAVDPSELLEAIAAGSTKHIVEHVGALR
jgi:hypothetical protein